MTGSSRPTALTAAIAGIPVGAVSGLFLGFCLAAAKLMGDAEVSSPSHLPAEPNLLTYLGFGLLAGIIFTPVVFVVSLHVVRLIRSYRKPKVAT